MAIWTNVGLTLIATAIQTNNTNVAPTYVGISTGCGTLATALVSGTPITSLILNSPGLPIALTANQLITVTDGTNTLACQVTSAGAAINATTIPIVSVTPVNNFANTTTGVAPTPIISDTVLYNESARIAISAGVAGSNPGESLVSAYFDGTQPTGLYMMVGYFGGSTATGTIATGTLIIEDVQVWPHTLNSDTASYQADNTI